MLQSIGDSLKGYTGSKWRKWFAYLVLGLLSLIFAAWGAYGIVNLNFGGSNYAAEANGIKIPLEEAHSAWLRQQTQWQQRLGGAELPAQLRAQLQNQVLESLIRDALLDKRTEELGYRVSREALREAVLSEPAFQIDGQYSPESRAGGAGAGRHLARRVRARAASRGAATAARGRDRRLGFPHRDRAAAPERAPGPGTRSALLRRCRPSSSRRPPTSTMRRCRPTTRTICRKYMTPESDHLQYAELRLEPLAAQQSA